MQFIAPGQFPNPVFVHNFREYDAHLIVHEFSKQTDREIKVIGQNMEKYLQVEWGKNMVFRDSLQLYFASLKQLTASLGKTGRDNFYNLHEVFTQIYPGSNVELLERTGVSCYNYVDFFARLDKPALFLQEALINKVEDVQCSVSDYAHAQQVYADFQC